MTISLADFLREAGLSGYEYALKEAGISCANDILEEANPLDLLELSFVEQQNFVRALVELRRRVIPSLPLPPGKTIHFYVSHSSRDLVEPVVYSLERAGATIFTHHAVTYRRAQGSISRWHIPRSGYMPAGVHRTADRLGTGNYQHQYGGGGSNHKGVTLSPAVTQQLSMHRDLSQSLRGFSDNIAQAHPSHRRVLGETTSATAGLDETTEVGAEAFMRESRHMLLVLSAGTLSREYVLQELRWAVQHCVPIVGVYEEGLDVRTELKSAPPDLKATLAKIDLVVLSVTSGGGMVETESTQTFCTDDQTVGAAAGQGEEATGVEVEGQAGSTSGTKGGETEAAVVQGGEAAGEGDSAAAAVPELGLTVNVEDLDGLFRPAAHTRVTEKCTTWVMERAGFYNRRRNKAVFG